MGFFSSVFGRARVARQAAAVSQSRTNRRGFRRLHIEQMEERRVMSAAPITIGAVYYDPASGLDNIPNTFSVSWNGGAAGTELSTLTINTDKGLDGLGNGDTFFDTAPGGLGVYGNHPLALVDNGSGISITNINSAVVDGGTVLTLDLSGFTAGKTLVFTIDVDEVGLGGSESAVAEGVEFEGAHLTGSFTNPDYFNTTGTAQFFDQFDPNFAGSGLNLPNDNYYPTTTIPSAVLTAGAIFTAVQPPKPSSLSGFVFNDMNLDNIQESGDPGISGVSLTLQVWNGSAYVGMPMPTTTTTDANGAYHFDNLAPGQYRVVETQPSGYYSVGARAGNIGGVPDGTVTTPDIISTVVLGPNQDSVHNDFAEALPGTISGHAYYDPNNNGLIDSGEPGIPNVSIHLYDAALNQVAVTTTDSTGYYQFTNLMPGNYTVIEDPPLNYLIGKDTVGPDGGTLAPPTGITYIQLNSGTVAPDNNFGHLLPASISGMVHVDMNGDCIYQEGEPLLAGVTIQLLDSSNTVIATTKTDSNGHYEFDNLTPFATYSVHEVQPPGYFEFGDTVGSAGGTLNGLDTINGATLNSGVNATDYNFCVQAPASISGMIHVDDNGDCIYEPGEQLLAGVTVQLINSSNVVVATTTTDDNGQYSFNGLQPGTYTVHEVQPVGYFEFGDTVGSVGGTLKGLDTIASVTLGSGVNGTDYDFCVQKPASISGMIHVDTNGDCIYEPGEPLLAGVTVQLIDNNNVVVGTTTTDENGEYTFSGLKPGTYTVHEVQPVGYFEFGDTVGSVGGTLNGLDTIASVTLGSGVNATDYDFCVQQPASISGMIHVDTNGDCIYEPGEPLLAGVTVQLIDSNNVVVGTTTTDENGEYKFSGLKPGSYTVHEVQPAGYFEFGDTVGSVGGTLVGLDTIASVTLGSGVNATDYDFCVQLPASIAGMVHVDENGDCVYQPGEPLLAGVTIQLIDSMGDVVSTTQTDAMGQYKFDNLKPGTYTVHEIQPAGYYQGGDSLGSVGGTIVDTNTLGSIALGSGVNGTDYDFCVTPPGSIAGMIHVDENGDCIYEPGEPLLAGVTVQLIDSQGQIVGTTQTDAMGQYKFSNVTPGTYTVHEVQPANYPQGGDSVGSIGGVIVDVDTLGGIVLAAGVNAVNYDFCETEPVCLSGLVFVDPNHNGRLDPNETPIPGVVIQLLDSSGNVIATTTTDAGGNYQFCSILPGTYGVHEIQPPKFLDDADYVGTAGGVLSNDLITQITLDSGVKATQYNFTEKLIFIIQPTQIVVPQLIPMATPPVPLYLVQTTPTPAPFIPLALYQGGGYVLGFTWHLSVIDAGRPRSDQMGDARVATISSDLNDPFQVGANDVHDSQWLLGMPGVDADGVENSRVFRFGMRNGIPVTGDFNGDGVTDVGFYYMGQWYIDLNGNSVWDSSDLWAKLGNDDDKPVTGDWDGDGKTDIGIFGRAWPGDPHAVQQEPGLPAPHNKRTGKQKNVPPETQQAALGYRTMKHTAKGDYRKDVIDHVFHYGTPTDIPITGDWHGTGIHTIGLFSKGEWILDTDADGRWTDDDTRFHYGQAGDIPVVGDFNGDGLDELGVYRDGVWYIDTNNDRVLDAHDRVFQLGGAGDTPVVGDWNGDGVDEPGVYQQRSGGAAVSK